MAIIECDVKGNFNNILSNIENQIINGSISATLEDRSDFFQGDSRCSVRIFERYSWTGGNRVSMNVTLFQSSEKIFLSVITSGGSQGVIFKINRWGEQSFLESIYSIIDKYRT